jgi:hypothetical protein
MGYPHTGPPPRGGVKNMGVASFLKKVAPVY